jgi:hypothetical protein
MAKIPYLVRRKNTFYFRLSVPAELRESINAREIIKSLKTENREEATYRALKLAAHYKAVLHDLKTGKAHAVNHLVLPEPQSATPVAPAIVPPVQVKLSAPIRKAMTWITFFGKL